MLKTVLKQGDWACLCNPEQLTMLGALSSIEELLQQIERLPNTFKNNHRSTVKQGTLCLDNDIEVVAKRPMDKNRRKWARLTSLFSKGEAATTIENLAKLDAAEVPSVSPLFALEKRQNGMIVDSWFCYKYRQGEPAGLENIETIIALLHKMHKAGFRHGDPTWNNFLMDNKGTMFTIDTKAKPCKGAFHATHDFLLLKRENSIASLDIDTLLNHERTTLGFRFALIYMNLKALRSWLKHKVKKNRPRNV